MFWTKKTYSKGNSKRHESIQHYLGCKLEIDGRVAGFLNIEIHNRRVFGDEDEMRDFMEAHIFAFKLLYEYQYLREIF